MKDNFEEAMERLKIKSEKQDEENLKIIGRWMLAGVGIAFILAVMTN